MWRNAMVIFGWGVASMIIFVLASSYRVANRVLHPDKQTFWDKLFMVGSGSKGGAAVAVA